MLKNYDFEISCEIEKLNKLGMKKPQNSEKIDKMNQKYDTTIVIISHQERILNLADEVILVADRTIREITSRQKILGEIGQLDSTCRCRQSCSRGGRADARCNR